MGSSDNICRDSLLSHLPQLCSGWHIIMTFTNKASLDGRFFPSTDLSHCSPESGAAALSLQLRGDKGQVTPWAELPCHWPAATALTASRCSLFLLLCVGGSRGYEKGFSSKSSFLTKQLTSLVCCFVFFKASPGCVCAEMVTTQLL